VKTYCIELRGFHVCREVQADAWRERDDWLIFDRNPPQGGKREYWRVRLSEVISMETKP
jgi:hypothetical protein